MTANLALELGCCASLVRCWLAGIASIAGSSLCGANLLRFGDHTGRALVCWGYPRAPAVPWRLLKHGTNNSKGVLARHVQPWIVSHLC